MTDKNIMRLAIISIAAACAACWALAARYNSIMWAVIAAWLAFALIVETWPRRDS